MSHLPSQPHASLIDCFKRQPHLARPLHDFAEQLMRGPSPFTAAQRERIAAHVSALNGCAFCRDSHNAVLAHLGASTEASQPELPDAGADAMSPILAYVRRLNDAPAQVKQTDVDAILEAGWDERAVEHAALVCGFFNLMNRWVDGLGIESDPEVVRMAGRMLHDQGYRAVHRLLEE